MLGLLPISDHYNADRNGNTWDATEVFNGYNRSNDKRYNLGPLFGDCRNPQKPTGWLSRTFGVRFRFNALDCKQGASAIVSPDKCYGLTKGVKPVLMAAGGTLAITDQKRAMGLLYFGKRDPLRPWRHDRQNGQLFPGKPQQEGPFVAISKPSKGKAAFERGNWDLWSWPIRIRDLKNCEK